MKRCPFCAEEIQDTAIKCRHCGTMLTQPVPQPATLTRPAPAAPAQPTASGTLGAFVKVGYGLLGFFLLVGIAVAVMNPARPPSTPSTAASVSASSQGAKAAAPPVARAAAAKPAPTRQAIQDCMKTRGVSITERVKKATTDKELAQLSAEVEGLEQACTTTLYAQAGQSVPEDTRLRATVTFTGSQFKIANVGSVDWTNVKFDLNGGLISSGYVLRLEELKAKSEYTVGAMQFADSNGTRFNPFQMKPQQMTISATLPSGSVGVRIVDLK